MLLSWVLLLPLGAKSLKHWSYFKRCCDSPFLCEITKNKNKNSIFGEIEEHLSRSLSPVHEKSSPVCNSESWAVRRVRGAGDSWPRGRARAAGFRGTGTVGEAYLLWTCCRSVQGTWRPPGAPSSTWTLDWFLPCQLDCSSREMQNLRSPNQNLPLNKIHRDSHLLPGGATLAAL